MSGSSSGSNASNSLAQGIVSAIATGSAVVAASAPGTPYTWTTGGTFPSVPSGQLGRVDITGSVGGTAILPVPYNVVTDTATAPVTVIANGSLPQAATLTGQGQLYDANGGAGYFVSGNVAIPATSVLGTGGSSSATGTSTTGTSTTGAGATGTGATGTGATGTTTTGTGAATGTGATGTTNTGTGAAATGTGATGTTTTGTGATGTVSGAGNGNGNNNTGTGLGNGAGNGTVSSAAVTAGLAMPFTSATVGSVSGSASTTGIASLAGGSSTLGHITLSAPGSVQSAAGGATVTESVSAPAGTGTIYTAVFTNQNVAEGMWQPVTLNGSGQGSFSAHLENNGDYVIAVDNPTSPSAVGESTQVTLLGAGSSSGGGAGSTSGAGAASVGGNIWFIGSSSSVNSFLASGGQSDSILAIQGTNWISTQNNSTDHIWASSGNLVVGSTGADTIATGAADATVNSTGNALVFGGTGTLNYSAGSGMSTLVGGSAAVTVASTGSDTMLAFGGSGGGNEMLADGAASTLIGMGNNDTLAAFGGTGNVLLAGSGNETLYAGASATGSAFLGGSGTDAMVSGAAGSTFYAGTGTALVVASGNGNAFDFTMGKAGGMMVIAGFNSSDVINLSGYAANQMTSALSSAQVAGGSTTITLSDKTKIELVGFTGLSAHNIA